MNTEKYPQIVHSVDAADWDDETLDELCYDEESMTKILDAIYEKTKAHRLFKKIYETAAAKMISLDPEIGLAVIMSYDYFSGFYACLDEFYKSPDEFNENTPAYIGLMKKLT
jgi:hypothetical protein